MSSFVPIRELLQFAIGGGWGSAIEEPGAVKVGVIRGADFPSIEHGDVSALPVRYETLQRANSRALLVADIILEISGGTKDRPTGRTVYIRKSLLSRSDLPLIPASFCRLVRVDPSKAAPRYVYYWLRAMYAAGGTWAYQHRSTGIANFQFEYFLDAEKVRLPSLAEQQAIAEVLGTLDDKIEANNRVSRACAEFATARFVGAAEAVVMLSDVAEITMGQSPPGESYNDCGDGTPFFQGTRDFASRHPRRRIWCTAPTRMAQPEDTLVSVRAPVGTVNVATEVCSIGRGIAAARNPTLPSTLYQALTADPTVWVPYESEGTVFGSINKQQLAQIKVPWPKAEQAGPLERVLSILDRRLLDAERESRVLAQLRNALLPRLLSGELRVRDAEAAVEGAV